MKKTCFTLLLLFFLGQTYAQVAQWFIPPAYDSIYFAKGAKLYVTDSANYKVFWNRDGQRLFATSEMIHPFSSGCAVMTNDTNSVLGFYDIYGRLNEFNNRKIKVANDYPYFSDDYLIVKKNRYYIIDSEGGIDKTKHLRVYPFRNGYAVCHDFENPDRQKGTVRYLMDVNKVAVPLTYDGKTYKAADVDFISSVNDEQLAIVVIKQSLYFLDMKDRHLSPIVFPRNDGKRPVQAEVDGDLPLSTDETAPIIHARCRKDEKITIYFNKQLVPTDIFYNGEETHYKQNVNVPEKPTSPLSVFVNNNKQYGLACDGKTIIPAQFDAIGRCFDNYAFAKFAGKHGLLQATGNAKLNLSINNDNEIGFRHQTYETIIRIDLPADINPAKINLLVDSEAGFTVDKISKQIKESNDGNRAEFTCNFAIPANITEQPAEFNYPIQVTCDNILLLPFQKTVKAWRDNYYDVIVNDAEKSYDKKTDMFSFPYTIDMERNPNEETYHFEMRVLPDDMDFDVEKTSTTRGVCSIPASELENGENDIYFEITEQGCPPLSFPFTINYKKPKGKKAPTLKDFKIEKMTL